jgi:Putative prokaryotic signal transducing protein
MKLITLKIYENELSATIFQQLLENEGVTARVFKNFSIRGNLFLKNFNDKGFELQVLEEDFEKAKVILMI